MSRPRSVVLFITSGPDTPERCATPFDMATVAAAMDCDAEMIFQMQGARLLARGAGERLRVPGAETPLAGRIDAARQAGVRLSVCSAALDQAGLSEEQLIEACDRVVGAAYMVDRALEADLVLCY